jgi:Uncharacterized protein conserved in bacteria
MPLIKDGRIAADPWQFVADEEPLPVAGPVAVSLPRWLAERDALLARETPVGVRLESRHKAEEIAPDLDALALVALEFPTFRDGRAYSTARLLRERHGYVGELRAVGNVLRDQFLFMHRCGFDAFEVKGERELDAWTQALAEISVFYQPTGDGRLTVFAGRPWRRAAE